MTPYRTSARPDPFGEVDVQDCHVTNAPWLILAFEDQGWTLLAAGRVPKDLVRLQFWRPTRIPGPLT
jgi:hypothetical protein